MQLLISPSDAVNPVSVTLLAKDEFEAWQGKQDTRTQNWLNKTAFKAVPGHTAIIPSDAGDIAHVVFITGKEFDPSFYARLPAVLPPGDYQIINELPDQDAHHLALGWALNFYQFDRYKTKQKEKPQSPRLVLPANADAAFLNNQVASFTIARDLINTPANDLTPQTLAEAAEKIAAQHGAKYSVIVGKDLLTENYPLVYHVGKASETAPRLVDIRWGNPDAVKITLVGKGVTFDTGGLDIKPADAMLTMKRDMGGSGTVLGLANLIMAQKLNVNLRVLIPAVENSISSNAMRPLDVLPTRKGITIEVGNTDAEGRMILADCLFEAAQEKPKLLIDFATLTGAARVALGPELPVVFCQQDDLTAELLDASRVTCDPVWPLPLWQGYRKNLESRVANLNTVSAGGFAGAIYAGLFLQEFVEEDTRWIHIDTYAWNYKSTPGRPEGGEALALRAVYELIKRQIA